MADLHYGENPWDAWGPEQDFNSTRLMNIVLPDEKPDYVSVSYSTPPSSHSYSSVLNGDLITGESILANVVSVWCPPLMSLRHFQGKLYPFDR